MIKDGIKNGTLQNLDFSKDLADAVEIYISAKEKNDCERVFKSSGYNRYHFK